VNRQARQVVCGDDHPVDRGPGGARQFRPVTAQAVGPCVGQIVADMRHPVIARLMCRCISHL
jgi:hypothetical protein